MKNAEWLYLANYEDLKELNQKTHNLTNSFLLSFLALCQSSKKCLDITTQKISYYTGFSQKKVNSHLRQLESDKLITKKRHKSNRIKCIYKSVAKINMEKTIKLNTITGSDEASILLTRILYGLNNTDIVVDDTKWVSFSIYTLSRLLGKSVRTTYRIVLSLINKNLLVRRRAESRKNAYYTISAETVEKLINLIRPIALKNETNHPSDTDLEDYTIYTQGTCVNNNNYGKDVNFLNKTNGNDPPLSALQLNYIKGAIKKTIPPEQMEQGRYKLIIEEVIYALKNMSNKNKKLSFINLVNILMKVIRAGKWQRPYGFEKYTEEGRKRREEEWGHYDQQIREHETIKKMWKQKASPAGSGGLLGIKDILKKLGNFLCNK